MSTQNISSTRLKTQAPDRSTLGAFLLMIVVGGANAVAVRFSNLELPPFWGATIRFSTTGLIFWVIFLARKNAFPRGRALQGLLLYGMLSIGTSYALLYWALVYVQAGLTTVILALGPLLTFLFAWAHGQEQFRWRGLLGAFIAFGGILVGVGGEIGRSVPLIPLLALVAAAASIAEASVLYKSFPRVDPLTTNAIATTVGAAMLLVISLIAGESQPLPASARTWIVFGYLVLVGSVLLFYLYLYVLDRWTASATSYSFLLFPVATVLIAAWLADEVVTPAFVLGGALVLFGVWVGALAADKRS